MCCDRVPVTRGNPLDRRFERGVLERLHLAAVVAHEMVVMVAAGVCGLEPGETVAQIDALHEADLIEALERPVHARHSDPDALRPEPFVDLLCGEAARLAVEVGDHLAARAAAAPARLSQTRERTVEPGRCHGR